MVPGSANGRTEEQAAGTCSAAASTKRYRTPVANMDVTPILDLADAWEDEAEALRARGLDREARMEESFAADLRERVRAWQMEALTVSDAAAESGYSESHLRTMLSDGALPNVGESGSPRIQRCDLPTKAGRSGPSALVSDALARRA